MTGSHPSSPVPDAHSTMASPRIERNPYRQPSHSQHRQRHSLPSQDSGNGMVVDLHAVGPFSPGGSSALTSGRSSVDHTIQSNATHDPAQESYFTARFSDFVRAARRDASSEHPVIETYIDSGDYRSLIAAVSNIQMSNSREGAELPVDATDFRGEEGNYIDSDDVLTHSPYSIQMDHIDNEGRTMNTDGSEYTYNNHLSGSHEHIYDLQHIMVQNQRRLEDQMLQARNAYARHRDADHVEAETSRNQNTATRLDNSTSRGTLASSTSMRSEGLEEQVLQSLHEPYLPERQYANEAMQDTFEPRPTISSSYFSATSESTIVLSSPPPGRYVGMFPYYSSDSVRPHPMASDYSDSSGNGMYHHFVTGRNLTLQYQGREDQPLGPHHNNPVPTAPGNSSPNLSGSDPDRDGGRVIDGESGNGRWSTFGSLTHRIRSFGQHRHQYYRRQRQRTAASQGVLDGVEFVNQGHTPSLTDDLGPRSAPSQLQTDGTFRRTSHAFGSLSYHGSNIPIPSRYVNPHPFSHPQYTSPAAVTSSSHMIWPHSLRTNFNELHGNQQANTSTNYDHYTQDPWLHLPIRSAPVYSETVEGAEAGGWIQPSSSTTSRAPHSAHSSLREIRMRSGVGMKEVVRMACRFCETIICERGMKAQLLADQSVALLSTDDAPQSVQLVGDEYKPTNCMCKIKDTACLVCGNVIGYHITQPCEKCLNADNNGHLWLFHPEYVFSAPRKDPLLNRTLKWNQLPEPEEDYETLSLHKVYLGAPEGKFVIGGMVRRDYDAICR